MRKLSQESYSNEQKCRALNSVLIKRCEFHTVLIAEDVDVDNYIRYIIWSIESQWKAE